jgi:hypothetical protein
MLLRYLLAGSMAVIASVPAQAAPQYFVLVGANRQCQLIEVQPLDATTIYKGSGYLTQEDAKAATASSCDTI